MDSNFKSNYYKEKGIEGDKHAEKDINKRLTKARNSNVVVTPGIHHNI